MKKLLLLSISFFGLLFCVISTANGQGGLGVNSSGNAADPSSIFDVSSTTKGALIPRMTTPQRDAIINPAEGLIIYNLDCHNYNYYNGTAWVAVNSITAGVSISSNPSGFICSGTSVTFTATAINGGPSATYQWKVNGVNSGTNLSAYSYIPVNGDVVTCVMTSSFTCGVIGSPATSNAITEIVTTLPTATIEYSGTPYCSNSGAVPVTLTGTSGGVYSSSPAGLSINTSNGTVATGSSNEGSYTVTYTIAAAGGCPQVTATAPVTITILPVATFSYTGTPYCFNAANPSPTFSGGGVAGTFSSSAGLVFVSTSTGEVNLSASTPGTYIVTNTFAASGGCSVVTATAPITITADGTGGTVTHVNGNTIHTFTSTGSFTPPACITSVEILVVAGGGGGGGSTAGGGGGGGLIYYGHESPRAGTSYTVTGGNPIAVTVGAGGAASQYANLGPPNNTNGGNSIFETLTAFGGGYGASGSMTASRVANSGGSGGGGGYYSGNNIPVLANGSGTVGQGNAGGTATATGSFGGAGGGGAGTVGGNWNGSTNIGGNGGAGLTYSISGSPVAYAGGGGGAGQNGGGSGGSGGGGAGGLDAPNADGSTATPNSGGGGGGASLYQSGNGGGGGSGIVIISYPTPCITPPLAPVAGTNTSSSTQIVWSWNTVQGAIGYKYNTTNDYSTATDNGINTSYTQTGLSCNNTYPLFVWAYNACGNSAVTTLTQTTLLPVATFSYTGTPYCTNAANPSPAFSGGGVAGTFSSTAGLVFVSTATGQVNLAASSAGTYTVTNTLPGCPQATATTPITITTLPVATFSYTGSPYCVNAANPSPAFSGGGVAGTFSSTAGLVFVSTSTGQVNLSASTAGTYTVTNTIAASGGCSVVTATSSITITADGTGGTITHVGGNTIHTFTSIGSFTFIPPCITSVEVLVVAGGGGGGGSTAGGGGGGGLIYYGQESPRAGMSYAVTAGNPVTVTVGGGGAGSRYSDLGSPNNTNGGNSIFGTATAFGGGYGASGSPSASRVANSGGSGGGGGYYSGNNIPVLANGAGTPGQGNAGGAATATGTYGGAGGGGAGTVGGDWNGVTNVGGNGGAGLTYSISGSAITYAGGGGGGGQNGGGAGGSGGGGAGGAGTPNTDGANGTANSGGGGGAATLYQSGSGGGGGSGIVIISYPTP